MYKNVDQNMSENVAKAVELLQQAETLEVGMAQYILQYNSEKSIPFVTKAVLFWFWGI